MIVLILHNILNYSVSKVNNPFTQRDEWASSQPTRMAFHLGLR
jgi:hypothetical protein